MEIAVPEGIGVLCEYLSDKEFDNIKTIHVYGSQRNSEQGPSALYITRNGEVYLVGFNTLVGRATTEEFWKGILERSTKVPELSGQNVQKIVVGYEFGAALSELESSNVLYLWGSDMGEVPSVIQVAVKCHYYGYRCPNRCCSQRLASDRGGWLSWCSKCDNVPNPVSTLPHPWVKDWRRQIRIAAGCHTEVPKKLDVEVFCIECGSCWKQHDVILVKHIWLLFCWYCGHLIDGNWLVPQQSESSPHKVDFETPHQILDIHAGENFLLVQTPEQLFVWGEIGSSRYNNGIMNSSDVIASKVSCGSNHVAVVSTEGELYTCGAGEAGQLGYSWWTHMGHMTLREVSLDEQVTDVVCGRNSTVCLLQSGSIIVLGDVVNVRSGGTWSMNLSESALVCIPSTAYVNKYGDVVESTMAHLLNPNRRSSPLLTGEHSDMFIHLEGLKGTLPENRPLREPPRLEMKHQTMQTDPQHRQTAQTNSEHVQNTPKPTEHSIDFADLFGKPLLSDLVLRLSDGEFPVHRSLLYTTSVYFRELFTDSAPPAVLDMSFYNATAYRNLLRYFYRVPVSELCSQDLFDLYLLASSYKEDWITQDVFARLKKSIDSKNVLFLHDKAKATNTLELLEECKIFINTPEFKKSVLDGLTQDEDLMVELLRLSLSKKSISD